MGLQEHKRKQGRKRKRGGRAGKRASLFVGVTLPGKLGAIVLDIAKRTGCSASYVCKVAIAKGLSGHSDAPTVELLVAEVARAHKRAMRERDGPPPAPEVILDGEGIGDAIIRRQKTLG